MADSNDISRRLGRIGLVWMLPILIAGAAGLIAFQMADEPPLLSRAEITVRPPTTTQSSTAALNLFVTDLGQQAESDAVTLFVLDQVPDLDPDSYPRDLLVERHGATSWVTLSFVHPDDAIARSVVEVLARRLLDDVARQDTERTQFLVDNATERLTQAEVALEEFSREQGVFDPETEYRILLDDISRLNAEIITISNSPEADEDYLDAITGERNRLISSRTRLGGALLEFRGLSADVANAQDALETAQTDHLGAEFEYASINAPENLVGTRELITFTDNSERLQRAALAAAVALVLALSIVVPLAWWLDKRHTQGRHIDLIKESMATDDEIMSERPLRELIDRH